MTTERPRRPRYTDPVSLESLTEGTDPIATVEAAHELAAVLVDTGRSSADPETTARLVTLTEVLGIEPLAELWSRRPARSLPGALWRLYLLREWVQRDPERAAREYAAGIRHTEPNHVVAGVEPTGPDEIRRVCDAILRGAFEGDFAVALERAAAFCHVVASGRADVGDRSDLDRVARLQAVAADLTGAAALWRAGTLS